ncbi:hypothetical protein [Amphritea sp.]|uniref:hypothetical protein n=1 Tax=Amphritea sp. TaxID=1872502 RepID=UPI003A8E9DF3
MIYRAFIILLFSVLVFNQTGSTASVWMVAEASADCHMSVEMDEQSRHDEQDCGMHELSCCEPLSHCCGAFSAAVFVLPTELPRFMTAVPVWAPEVYFSAISPPPYHPPRAMLLPA